MQIMRTNAVYITLPAAAIVGFIGYNIENLISDKYTPYSSMYLLFPENGILRKNLKNRK